MEITNEDTRPIKQEQDDSDQDTKTEIMDFDSSHEHETDNIRVGADNSCEISRNIKAGEEKIKMPRRKFKVLSMENLREKSKRSLIVYAVGANTEIQVTRERVRQLEMLETTLNDVKEEKKELKVEHKQAIEELKVQHKQAIEELKVEMKTGFEQQLKHYKESVDFLRSLVKDEHLLKDILNGPRDQQASGMLAGPDACQDTTGP